MLGVLYKFGVPLMNLGQPESALEEVKRRVTDKVIEVLKGVVTASSPTPVLVKVENFGPLPLSALMEEPLRAISRLRDKMPYLLNGVKPDNLLVSQFRG